MQTTLYSHRLKTVLQHTVRDLGVTISIDDSGSDFSVEDNLAMMKETAQLMHVRIHVDRSSTGTVVIFSPRLG
jgi:EAL domain-containing protein (putative c-di-GMP-specific phosphodiesterase class I)